MADSATDVGVHEVEDVYVCHWLKEKQLIHLQDLNNVEIVKQMGLRQLLTL